MRFVLVFLVSISSIAAQELASRNTGPSVLVHGEATVSAQPDRVEIDIGVVTQASTSQAAAASRPSPTGA